MNDFNSFVNVLRIIQAENINCSIYSAFQVGRLLVIGNNQKRSEVNLKPAINYKERVNYSKGIAFVCIYPSTAKTEIVPIIRIIWIN